MTLKEMPNAKCRKIEPERETSCLNRGGGRYFIIHRVSQFAKRNPNKEMQKRLKEIDRLERYRG
ncbi:MAG: hypothetical protein MPW14_18605 [Candidatus Manganitrophus sp.]|nr:hypothetical protein [Candidatus Manganitrophus sp.]WDT69280.1 MAG: hypothetical protein MPW17_10805 [Candidatus Manganitrophus sp.]WDT74497.1 MAG: hypothetical protein MPW16_14690 [Candidatus Manganitrophus sp.]WDT79140.1 MAG: hypothetical protein MPW14_18605 [Candidatus Manganitrophus sp.]